MVYHFMTEKYNQKISFGLVSPSMRTLVSSQNAVETLHYILAEVDPGFLFEECTGLWESVYLPSKDLHKISAFNVL